MTSSGLIEGTVVVVGALAVGGDLGRVARKDQSSFFREQPFL